MTLSLQRTLFLLLTVLVLMAALIGAVGMVSSQMLPQKHNGIQSNSHILAGGEKYIAVHINDGNGGGY